MSVFFRTALATALLLASACAASSSERVDELADKLQVLSMKAEGISNYSDTTLTPETLEHSLRELTPKTLRYFEGYRLFYRIQDKHVGVLLCDAEGKYLIAEDSACTVAMDRKDYSKASPCAFAIDLQTACLN